MTAHVIEAAQFSVDATYQKQRFSNEVRGEIVASIHNLRDMAHDLPCSGEYLFFFRRVDLSRRIETGGQRPRSGDISVDMKWIVIGSHGELALATRETFYGKPRQSESMNQFELRVKRCSIRDYLGALPPHLADLSYV